MPWTRLLASCLSSSSSVCSRTKLCSRRGSVFSIGDGARDELERCGALLADLRDSTSVSYFPIFRVVDSCRLLGFLSSFLFRETAALPERSAKASNMALTRQLTPGVTKQYKTCATLWRQRRRREDSPPCSVSGRRHVGRMARRLGVPVTGSLGMLLRAKQVGLVVELRSLITRLQSKGDYYMIQG
jgi:hypothetical protein